MTRMSMARDCRLNSSSAMTKGRHRALLVSGLAGALGAGLLAFATARSLRDLPVSLDVATEGIVKPVILARDGARLTVSLQNAWNTTEDRKSVV